MPNSNSDQALSTRATSLSAPELQELISRRAYEVYERRGGAPGDDLGDWLLAEQEVLAELNAAGQEAAAEAGAVAEKPAPRRRSSSGTAKPRTGGAKRSRKPTEPTV